MPWIVVGQNSPSNSDSFTNANLISPFPFFLQFDRYQEFLQFKGKPQKVLGVAINVTNQGIGDYGMEHFGNTLKRFVGTQQLQVNLANNKITHSGAALLSQALFSLNDLRSVNLSFYK